LNEVENTLYMVSVARIHLHNLYEEDQNSFKCSTG
jgi:hypothetical protein